MMKMMMMTTMPCTTTMMGTKDNEDGSGDINVSVGNENNDDNCDVYYNDDGDDNYNEDRSCV